MAALKKIINAKIVSGNKIIEGDILIKDGFIYSVADEDSPNFQGEVIDAQGNYVLPGFIDIHTNGSGGFDCTSGKYNPETREFQFDKENYLSGVGNALRSYAENGCTKVVLSTIAAPVDQVKQVINYIKEYKNSDLILSEILFGIMIEGSFIKEPANGGAHNPVNFRAPEREILEQFVEGNEEIIKIVNIPPEWGNVSYEACEYLRRKKVISAVGHTAATAEQIKKAASLGMKLGLHLFNGPSSSSFKPLNGGGTIEELLKSDDIFIEIIADGYHVDKSYFMDALKRKRNDKFIVVTDNMFITDSDITGEFAIDSKVGVVSDNGKFLYIKDNPGALFGSNLKMKDAFENLLNWLTNDIEGVWTRLHKAVNPEDAILTAAKLLSSNPAKLLGLDHETGSVEKGKTADLIVTEIQYDTRHSVRIDKVISSGNVIYSH